jgi:maltose-binding protein MalE
MSVTGAVAVNGYSEHSELANRFAAYLTCSCADELYQMTGKASANIHGDADNEPLQIFLLEYADSVPLPKLMEAGNFWLQLERLFAGVWNGDDVTESVQELAAQMTSQLTR